MPNWTDENGKDWFGKLECKRCLNAFNAVDGEIPPHDCLGETYKSESNDGYWHYPVPCKAKMKFYYWIKPQKNADQEADGFVEIDDVEYPKLSNGDTPQEIRKDAKSLEKWNNKYNDIIVQAIKNKTGVITASWCTSDVYDFIFGK